MNLYIACPIDFPMEILVIQVMINSQYASFSSIETAIVSRKLSSLHKFK